MNKDIIKELRIGSYIAIIFYLLVILILTILLYEGQLSFAEKIIIIGISFVKEIGELKAKIKNSKDES